MWSNDLAPKLKLRNEPDHPQVSQITPISHSMLNQPLKLIEFVSREGGQSAPPAPASLYKQ